jgi:hypothetical protein
MAAGNTARKRGRQPEETNGAPVDVKTLKSQHAVSIGHRRPMLLPSTVRPRPAAYVKVSVSAHDDDHDRVVAE